MLGYLSADIICSEKRSSRKTVSYEEQIMSKDKYPSIFSPQMATIVFIILRIFFATRAVLKIGEYSRLVYTTKVNSAFRACWLASSEVISQVLFTSEQPTKNKMAVFGILSQIKLLFGPLVIHLVWYILKQLFTSVSVKVVDIYLAAAAR